jgi:hypothetical protein
MIVVNVIKYNLLKKLHGYNYQRDFISPNLKYNSMYLHYVILIAGAPAANPFAASPFGPPPKPTINQIQMMQRPQQQQQQNYTVDPWAPVTTLPNPLLPAASSNIPNPFLS